MSEQNDDGGIDLSSELCNCEWCKAHRNATPAPPSDGGEATLVEQYIADPEHRRMFLAECEKFWAEEIADLQAKLAAAERERDLCIHERKVFLEQRDAAERRAIDAERQLKGAHQQVIEMASAGTKLLNHAICRTGNPVELEQLSLDIAEWKAALAGAAGVTPPTERQEG